METKHRFQPSVFWHVSCPTLYKVGKFARFEKKKKSTGHLKIKQSCFFFLFYLFITKVRKVMKVRQLKKKKLIILLEIRSCHLGQLLALFYCRARRKCSRNMSKHWCLDASSLHDIKAVFQLSPLTNSPPFDIWREARECSELVMRILEMIHSTLECKIKHCQLSL